MLWKIDTPVILYGAAYLGTLFNNYLRSMSNIIAFLDKRADEISNHCELPVYLPESTPFNQREKDNLIVIISVKNVFDHEDIADKLQLLGFSNIITYKSAFFQAIIDKKLVLPSNVQPYHVEFHFEWKDNAYIKKQSERVTALIPVPLIFTNKNNADSSDKWSDWPIQSLYPHYDLFSFYNGDAQSDAYAYVEEYCIAGANRVGNIKTSERWKQNILESRQRVFNNMDLNWRLNTSFFYDNAPTAEYNGGRFNLTAGKHRAAFLVSKGEAFIPLSIESTDYSEFLNLEKAQMVMRCIERLQQKEILLPIIHPYFYNFPCRTGFALYSIIHQLLLFEGRMFLSGGRNISELKVFSQTSKYTALARYFMQIGSYVYSSEGNTELDLLLDGLAFNDRRKEKLKSKYYDIAIFELTDSDDHITVASNSYVLFTHDITYLEKELPSNAFRITKLHHFFYDDYEEWVVLAVKLS